VSGSTRQQFGDPCGTPPSPTRRVAAEDERGPHRRGRRSDKEDVTQHEQGGDDEAQGAEGKDAGYGQSGRGQDADVQAGYGQQVREACVGKRAAGRRLEPAALGQQDGDRRRRHIGRESALDPLDSGGSNALEQAELGGRSRRRRGRRESPTGGLDGWAVRHGCGGPCANVAAALRTPRPGSRPAVGRPFAAKPHDRARRKGVLRAPHEGEQPGDGALARFRLQLGANDEHSHGGRR
jgi:hypothetical protein